MSNIVTSYPPNATSTKRGLVSASTQSFGGNKTFVGEIIASAGVRFADNSLQTSALGNSTYSFASPGTGTFGIGHVVRFTASSVLAKSDSSTAGLAREVAGIAVDADDTTTSRIATLYGAKVDLVLDAVPSSGDVGKAVFLSGTVAGAGSLTAPTTAGKRVYRLGLLVSATPADNGGYPIIFQPAFVADL